MGVNNLDFFNTFDLKQTLISFGGVEITGIVDFKYTPDGDDYSYAASNDGGGESIANNANNGAMVEITLLQTSKVNDKLSFKLAQQKVSGSPSNFIAKDLRGPTLFQGLGKIFNRPETTWNGEPNNKAWRIKLAPSHVSFNGGNI